MVDFDNGDSVTLSETHLTKQKVLRVTMQQVNGTYQQDILADA